MKEVIFHITVEKYEGSSHGHLLLYSKRRVKMILGRHFFCRINENIQPKFQFVYKIDVQPFSEVARVQLDNMHGNGKRLEILLNRQKLKAKEVMLQALSAISTCLVYLCNPCAIIIEKREIY